MPRPYFANMIGTMQLRKCFNRARERLQTYIARYTLDRKTYEKLFRTYCSNAEVLLKEYEQASEVDVRPKLLIDLFLSQIELYFYDFMFVWFMYIYPAVLEWRACVLVLCF